MDFSSRDFKSYTTKQTSRSQRQRQPQSSTTVKEIAIVLLVTSTIAHQADRRSPPHNSQGTSKHRAQRTSRMTTACNRSQDWNFGQETRPQRTAQSRSSPAPTVTNEDTVILAHSPPGLETLHVCTNQQAAVQPDVPHAI